MAIHLRLGPPRCFAEAGARKARPHAVLWHASGAGQPGASDRHQAAVARAPVRVSGWPRFARAWLCEQLLIAMKGAGDVVVEIEPAVGEHRTAVAILANSSAVMRHQDDVGALHAVAK